MPRSHDAELLAWLTRDTDPALLWQVQRDLVGEPADVWRATRRRVVTEGFGSRLLAVQDADGQWAGGAHFPADLKLPDAPEEPGQPYTATSWSLNALREWGVDAAALAGTAEKLAANCRWEYDDLPFWQGEVDCCINAYTLANGVWLGVDMRGLADWFIEHRLADGGWNCEWVQGSTRSSFHSTLNSVDGLLYYESATGGSEAVRAARHAGEQYLLQRRLMRRQSTGELVGPWVTANAYPGRWIYSALRALDHFRAAALYDGGAADPRLADAVDVVRAARQPDGTWLQEWRPEGRVWFEVDVPPGEPSKWLTFFALRVLDWWDVGRRA